MIKILLFLTSLEVGCQVIPPFPEIKQFGVHADIEPPGFYGVDNYTHQRFYYPFDEKIMKGAQCMNAEDYKASERWVSSVKLIAETRCVCH